MGDGRGLPAGLLAGVLCRMPGGTPHAGALSPGSKFMPQTLELCLLLAWSSDIGAGDSSDGRGAGAWLPGLGGGLSCRAQQTKDLRETSRGPMGSSDFFSLSCLISSSFPLWLLLFLLLVETEQLAGQDPRGCSLGYPRVHFTEALGSSSEAVGLGRGTSSPSPFRPSLLPSAPRIPNLCFPPSLVYVRLNFPASVGKQ